MQYGDIRQLEEEKMPTRKTLKSVAHNIGHSMLSLMNYDGRDGLYYFQKLFNVATETGKTKVEYDLIKETITPAEYDVPSIRLRSHFGWLKTAAEAENSSVDFIKSARMTIEFDLSKTSESKRIKGLIYESYVCTVIIIDDKGKEHNAIVPEWWNYQQPRKKPLPPKLTWWEKVWKRNKFN